MPLLLGKLLAGLLALVDSFVGRVLLALGLGFATYSGIDTGLGWILAEITSSLGALDSTILGILGVLRVDQVVTILLSAVSARLGLQGIRDGARRLVGK